MFPPVFGPSIITSNHKPCSAPHFGHTSIANSAKAHIANNTTWSNHIATIAKHPDTIFANSKIPSHPHNSQVDTLQWQLQPSSPTSLRWEPLVLDMPHFSIHLGMVLCITSLKHFFQCMHLILYSSALPEWVGSCVFACIRDYDVLFSIIPDSLYFERHSYDLPKWLCIQFLC